MRGIGNRNSQHSFAQIPDVNTPRSKFNRSFTTKDTANFDELTPIFIDEIYPGDTCNLNVNSFIRLATQVVPVLDNMYVDFYFFFVPNRLCWDNWEKLMGAQNNPGDSTSYLTPQVSAPVGGWVVGSMADHFGIPTEIENMPVNALPFRATNIIRNEWFRDQNLQNSSTVNTGDGPDLPTAYPMFKTAKKHDYFTSALPFPQKGSAVSLPLGTTAPVLPLTTTTIPTFAPSTNLAQVRQINFQSASTTLIHNAAATGTTASAAWVNPGLYADLSAATAATINQLRLAMMTQSLLELDARAGTRYVEVIRAHFNVVSPDFRLQRPEYLSGGTITINQHPVAQTSESTANSPQANLAAFSTASTSGGTIGFSKSFVEHGWVLGYMRARGEVTYQQGLNKMWSRRTKLDYFWPKFQELGEQAILNKEIRVQGTPADDLVFGYQERFGELRYYPSMIKGQFRSTFAQSLDVWHLAEEFGTLPALNDTFIQGNTPIERVLEVTEGYPALLCDFFFDYKHARPMVAYGVPASLGRF